MDDVNPLDVRLVRADDTNPWHGLDNLGLHDPLLLKLLLLKLMLCLLRHRYGLASGLAVGAHHVLLLLELLLWRHFHDLTCKTGHSGLTLHYNSRGYSGLSTHRRLRDLAIDCLCGHHTCL